MTKIPNELWNDSCKQDELKSAVNWGACGATSNPPLMWKAIGAKDGDYWRRFIAQTIRESEPDSIDDLAWRVMRHIAVEAAAVLEPIWRESGGRKGLLSVQVDPRRHSDADFMIKQAIEISNFAPNLSIKIPVTEAGLEAVTELAARGVNTTATVSFTVPQVVRVAEAFQKGLTKGKTNRPVQNFAVVMVGRLDDFLRDKARDEGISIAEDVITKAGVAVVKKAYRIFRERGYTSRLLIGAMRGDYHITEFLGGDIVLTIPPKLHNVVARGKENLPLGLANPVDEDAITELLDKLPDFARAYEEDGMSPNEFEHFGSSVRTLNQFIGAFNDIVAFVEGIMREVSAGG